MKVLFAGGGTAGHINPALAIAGYLREREPDVEILYIGAKGGMEERLVPAAGYPFKSGGTHVHLESRSAEDPRSISAGCLCRDGRLCQRPGDPRCDKNGHSIRHS